MADFETTVNADDCRVWGWSRVDIAERVTVDDVEIGNTLDGFIDTISARPSITYFHNLRFDGAFIVDWLFRAGFTWTDEMNPGAGQFSTLISNMGKWYTLTVRWENGVKTEFRDSLKKIPLGVDQIAKSYHLPISKGEIDYFKDRPVGYEPDENEREYMANDVLIVAKALYIQIAEGMSKITVGSDSIAEYRRLTGSKLFSRLFPILPLDLDAELRKAYRGGFTYANPRFQGKRVGAGKVYDVNSLYPSVMYDELMPMGQPIYEEGAPDPNGPMKLYITSITFTAKLKKDHIPCIQIKNNGHFINTVYQEHITEPTTLYVTSVDLELWREHYVLDIHSYNGTWYFKGVHDVFKAYIDKWMKVKAESTGGLREIAKLHLNSLYGKFATNPDVTGKVPVFEDNKVRLVTGEEDTREPVYTPMGAFITAYARAKTIRAAQQHFDVFAYCDTDSLHLLCEDEPEALDVHPHRLGAWKHEYDFTEAFFVRAKAYSERVKDTGELHTRIAGLPVPEAAKLTFDDLHNGSQLGVKKVPRTVPGGVVLQDQVYTLKF